MCDELQNGSVPLFIQTPNGRDDTGVNRDCFIIDPTVTSPLHLNMFRFLGVLMGIAIRTGSPINLNLAPPIWKQLVGLPLTINDLSEVDSDYVQSLLYIRDNPEQFTGIDFTAPNSNGRVVRLHPSWTHVSLDNHQEYFKLSLYMRLHEFDQQVAVIREGMSRVVPVPLLSLFTGPELETMVCGSREISVELLKSVTTYKGIDHGAPLVQWFWEVMEAFTQRERSLFLRFVWGRTRLPRTAGDFRGRDFVLQVSYTGFSITDLSLFSFPSFALYSQQPLYPPTFPFSFFLFPNNLSLPPILPPCLNSNSTISGLLTIALFRCWTSTILRTTTFPSPTHASFCSKCRATPASLFWRRSCDMPSTSASLLTLMIMPESTYRLGDVPGLISTVIVMCKV